MARVLVYTSPARGHLYPITGVLAELRGRGHEVHARTLASELVHLRRIGIHAEPLAPAIEALPLADWHQDSPEAALAGGLGTFAARAPHESEDLDAAIDALRPDLLVVDVTTAGAAAVAEASGIAWAQWIPFFQHVTVDGATLPPPGLIPFALLPEGREVLAAARRRCGLAPLGERQSTFRAPLYLYFTAPPFQPDGVPLPDNVRQVGPGLWSPPAPSPAWLDDIERPLVLVTASSEYQNDHALITAALEGLPAEGLVVAASTAAHDPAAFAVPEGAHVERWLPHQAVLERAACVVCHGGMGITQRSLAAGVPVCVVPYGRDQAEVAARVAAAGAGASLAPEAVTAPALRDAVRRAMDSRAGAQRVAAGFARAGGPPAAADALEDLLARTVTSV